VSQWRQRLNEALGGDRIVNAPKPDAVINLRDVPLVDAPLVVAALDAVGVVATFYEKFSVRMPMISARPLAAIVIKAGDAPLAARVIAEALDEVPL
jgi:hypothetical protein